MAGRGRTEGALGRTFYARFRRYLVAAGLQPTGLHILRHSAAKLRRDAGESVETVSAFLDHSSLAVTTTYLRRLEGVEDHSWERVAEAIGVLTAILVLAAARDLRVALGRQGGAKRRECSDRTDRTQVLTLDEYGMHSISSEMVTLSPMVSTGTPTPSSSSTAC